MTRLVKDDIDHIARRLDEYDAQLKRVTNASLRQIACKASGVREAAIVDLQDRIRIAAVPISSGHGVIDGFCNAVAAIVSFLGFETFVTEETDVTGIALAIDNGADILLLADDDRFVAIVPEKKIVVDNCRATAAGFVTGLELMKRGFDGESVLVLGCGPLGVAAGKTLIDLGANVALCDMRRERALAAFNVIIRHAPDRVFIEGDFHTAIDGYEMVFDASNRGGFIEAHHLTGRTLVAAPGMPCALTSQAMVEHGDRVLHDSLEIGTATMAVQAAKSLVAGSWTDEAAEQ
jgi:pyrrolysine biosynthesis protein PylD